MASALLAGRTPKIRYSSSGGVTRQPEASGRPSREPFAWCRPRRYRAPCGRYRTCPGDARSSCESSHSARDRSATDHLSRLREDATRAAIIEVLLKRGFVTRNGKSLEATDKGIRLIEVVHPEVKSPAMTGQWEAYLHRIHRGCLHSQDPVASLGFGASRWAALMNRGILL